MNRVIEKLNDILTDLEMTNVDTGAYIDSAKERITVLIGELKSEIPSTPCKTDCEFYEGCLETFTHKSKNEGLVLRLYTVIDDIVGHLEERSGSDCELQIHLLDYLRAIEIKKEIESLGIL